MMDTAKQIKDLSGCSFGLDRNDVCDFLLCKFRCPKSDEQKNRVKLGKLMCPRNVEYVPRHRLHDRDTKSCMVSSRRLARLGV